METIIISLGGSLIVPNVPDIDFLKKFKKLILSHAKKDMRFVIITGGGKTCRNYQEAAKQVSKVSDEDLDWLGIHATRLNAHLLRTIFKEESEAKFVKDPTKKIIFNKKILIAAGWKPGFSTDMDAVLLAKKLGAKKIINLSNIDYVYNKDPEKYPDAKIIKEITWNEFIKIVGNKWNPGLNAPFDPVASAECKKLKIKVYIANGNNIKNIDKVISGKKFIGTIISP